MPSYPLLPNEDDRLKSLRSYQILDTGDEKDFDDLTELASGICEMPMALISLVDKNRQWFKSRFGVSFTETDRESSFCTYTIASTEDITIIEDTRHDQRFANNPFVKDVNGIVFYAAVPLVNRLGFALGTLCVLDNKPNSLTGKQIKALKIIARQVTDKLELRKQLIDLEVSNDLLKESQLRVTEAELTLRSLIEQATVAIIVFKGENLIIEAANPLMLELLNKDVSIVGKPLLEAIPELAGQEPYKLLLKVYKTGDPVYGDETPVAMHRNGKYEVGYFNFSYTPLIENGKITGVIDMASEVTEQFLARQKIQQAEENLKLAIRAANLGTWQVDLKTDKLTLSDRAREVHGLMADEPISFSESFNLISPEFRVTIKAAFDTAIATRRDFTEEFIIHTKNHRQERWIRSSGKVIYDPDGQPVLLTGTLQDVTELKEFEQRKDDFISIASHELKTPITTLKGTIQLLDRLKSDTTSPMIPKLIDQSNQSIEKLNNLVNDLLNATRMNEGQIQLDKHWFTFSKVFDTCCNHIISDGKHELRITGDLETEVFADESRIEQVIVNLVNNASKYAPDSFDIDIHVEQEKEMIRVEVTDHGPGIPPEKLPYLFERYYRSDNSGVHYFGLGLGLYICSEIVKRHGGEIGADSVPGEGSTFWFTVPVYPVS